MEKLLQFLIEKIVDHPQDIRIQKEKQEKNLVLRLSVNPEDLKTVIGKEGKTIKALREMLFIKASRQGEKVNLILEEDVKKETSTD